MFVISLFWLGFCSREEVPYWIPMLSGIPFGLGFMCVFQALLNYLTDAYEIFAASANAAASCSRSLLATLLPLATAPMFHRLGIAGACSLLGGMSLVMTVMPFVFLWQGERIRAGSEFCRVLREERQKMERMVEDQRERRSRRMTEMMGMGVVGGMRLSAYGQEGVSRGEATGEEGNKKHVGDEKIKMQMEGVEKGRTPVDEMEKGQEMDRKSSSNNSRHRDEGIQGDIGHVRIADLVNYAERPEYGADEVGESSFSHDHDHEHRQPGSGSRSGSSATVAVSPPSRASAVHNDGGSQMEMGLLEVHDKKEG